MNTFRRPKIGIGQSITEEEEHHDVPANTGCHESAAPDWQKFREPVGWIWKARRRMHADMSENSIILDNVESRASCLARWESLRNSMWGWKCILVFSGFYIFHEFGAAVPVSSQCACCHITCCGYYMHFCLALIHDCYAGTVCLVKGTPEDAAAVKQGR